jgi:fructose-1,6-bisphosphatase/inositol monophosphatase family enzyme
MGKTVQSGNVSRRKRTKFAALLIRHIDSGMRPDGCGQHKWLNKVLIQAMGISPFNEKETKKFESKIRYWKAGVIPNKESFEKLSDIFFGKNEENEELRAEFKSAWENGSASLKRILEKPNSLTAVSAGKSQRYGIASSKYILEIHTMAAAIASVHSHIQKQISKYPNSSFQDVTLAGKHLAEIDWIAEKKFKDYFEDFSNVEIIGEESLRNFVTAENDHPQYQMLIDVVDGTDLLQRGLYNWCSAVVVANIKEQKIEAAFVCLAEGTLYFANEAGAFCVDVWEAAKNEAPHVEQLRIDKNGPKLKDASICMYAQKSSSLLSLVESYKSYPKFIAWLQDIAKSDERLRQKGAAESRFRYYNLAGNPMMVRLAEQKVHVVSELRGQSPHDLIPGAFIAMKAGAVFGDVLKFRTFTELDLLAMLRDPAKTKVRYILASTRELYDECFQLMNNTKRLSRQKQARSRT